MLKEILYLFCGLLCALYPYFHTDFIDIALEHYNNGNMKRCLCELFINIAIGNIEIIVK